MKKEKNFEFSPEKITPASEQEKELPETLRDLHEIKGEFLSHGVFFDVYDTDLKGPGKKEMVIKDFRGGDIMMSPKDQAALFQHQYYEWMQLRSVVGENFFPESFWIRSPEFSEDEAHKYYKKPGKSPLSFPESIKLLIQTQLSRHLRKRFSADDYDHFINDVTAKVSEITGLENYQGEFVGAIVQEKIHGVSFKKALEALDKDGPAYEKLRENTRNLIRNLRVYHEQSDYAAFTWHRLSSENVMCETDENNKPTGRVVIVDANFTERPKKIYKDKVVKTIEKDIFQKLEDELEL